MARARRGALSHKTPGNALLARIRPSRHKKGGMYFDLEVGARNATAAESPGTQSDRDTPGRYWLVLRIPGNFSMTRRLADGKSKLLPPRSLYRLRES